MDDKELRETLQRLHNELDNAEEMDEESTQLLKHLMGDIQTHLERSGETTLLEYQPLSEILRKSIQHFEVDHPTLVATMGKALDILSRMGV